MLTYLKHGFVLTALSLSLAAQAGEIKNTCDNSLTGCGIQFTTIPATPSLTTATTYTPYPHAYVVTNTGTSSVTLNSISLVKQSDDTVGAGAVTLDPSSTCAALSALAASATCDIYLDFQPTVAGLLDWNLIVTTQSSQLPLTLDITTMVTLPPPPFALAGGVYWASSTESTFPHYYPLLAIGLTDASTWSYAIDSANTLPSGYDVLNASQPGVVATSCPGSSCLAVGYYYTTSSTSSDIYPFISSLASGTPSYVFQSTSTFPSDFDNVARFTDVSCSGDLCMATGLYALSDTTPVALAYVSTNGGASWTVSLDSSNLPSDAVSTSPSYVTGVSCTGSTCVLAGSYTNSSPDLQPLLGVSTDSGSTWTYPTLTIPSDVAGNLYLSAGVSCTSTVCVAGGKYLNGSYAAPLLYMSTDGGSSWTLAIASNSITSGPTPSDWVFGQITSVGCSVSACMAAGTYHSSDVSSSHFPYAAVAVESDSSWAWNVVADASTATPAGISDVASINGFLSATCTGTTCLASGAYEDTGGTQYPMVAQTIGLAALTYTLDSSWSSPPHLFSNLGTFAEISCSGAVCTAAGSYQDSSSDTYPLVGVSSNSGTAWTFDIDATPDTLPIFFDSIGRFTATSAN